MFMDKVFVCLLLVGVLVWEVNAYGEPNSNGRPVWLERANHAFANAVRLDPTKYKAIYMATYSPSPASILTTAKYPAVAPLYWESTLNEVAYQHSYDLASHNMFQHDSTDGTKTFDRIKKVYTCHSTMGENIAAGYDDPLKTNNQWLCDAVGSACAADGSGSDGHRSGIMNKGYKAVGIGYVKYTGSTYTNYWTEDFGGAPCSPAPTNAIYSGSHYFPASGKIAFVAQFYQATGGAPSSANVYIDGVATPITLDLGTANAGNYASAQSAAATVCRNYYFEIVDSTGKTHRYPDTGFLVTFKEGSCATSYAPGGSTTAPPTTTTAAPTTTTTKPPSSTTTTTTTTTTTRAPTTTTTTTRAPTTTTTTTTEAPTTTTTTTQAPSTTKEPSTTTTTTTETPTTTTTTETPTTKEPSTTTTTTTETPTTKEPSTTTTTTTEAPTTTTTTTRAPSTTTTTTRSPSTTTTRAPSTTTTRAPSTTTTRSPSTTTTTTKPPTTGGHVLYDTKFQNSWSLVKNSKVVVTDPVTYSGQSAIGVKLTAKSDTSNNWFAFYRNPSVSTAGYTNLVFNAAASASGSFTLYFNGGTTQTKTFTTSWQTFTISLSSLGSPASIGNPKYFVVQNPGSSAVTVYFKDVKLA